MENVKGVEEGGRVQITRRNEAAQQKWKQGWTQLSAFAYWISLCKLDKYSYPEVYAIYFIAAIFSELCKLPSHLSLCACLFYPLFFSPVHPSGDLPADAGFAVAGLCQILPSALPSRSPDWKHSYRPGGLLGEMAADTILWSTLSCGDFLHEIVAVLYCSCIRGASIKLHHCYFFCLHLLVFGANGRWNNRTLTILRGSVIKSTQKSCLKQSKKHCVYSI